MTTETSSNIAFGGAQRRLALAWIDAFNARDDAAEAAARTADYIAHAPESIEPAPLDSDAWVGFLGVFVEGFPDLHLEVLGVRPTRGWSRSASCSPGRTPARSAGSRRPAARSGSPAWRSTGWSTGRSPSTGSRWTRSRSSSSSACTSSPARGWCHGSWLRR